jgi:CRP/FNR family transcriptional regulator, cyclic AMP receptor protein
MTQSHILRDHAFMRGLTGQQIDALAELASEVSFSANELILADGQSSRFFYLIASGSVAVELRTQAYVVCIQALGPGEVFGWSALLPFHHTLFQVRAREATTALSLEGAALKLVFQADPVLRAEVLERALQVVAGRVRATELRFGEMCGVRV